MCLISCKAPVVPLQQLAGVEVSHTGHRFMIKAKDDAVIIFMIASDSVIAEVPIDSLIKYYYLSKKEDHGHNK